MVKSNQKILDVRRLNTVLNTDNGDISVVTNLTYHVNKGQTLGIIGIRNEDGDNRSTYNVANDYLHVYFSHTSRTLQAIQTTPGHEVQD